MAERSSFGPVVGVGLASAALLAVASARPWFELASDTGLPPGIRESEGAADSPLALALALVVLAGWGALLVTRARARRLVATTALVAGLGVLAAVVAAPLTLPDQVRDQLDLGDVSVAPTGWLVVAALAAVTSVLALVAAWRLVPTWPEMGTRYDAPGAAAPARDVDPGDPRALWKALDEGQDPTEGPTEGPGPRDVP